MGTNTAEFRAMIQSTSDLTNAVKLDIRSLCDDLLDVGIIAPDNHSTAINQLIDVSQRASQLVSLIRTRVQLNPSNFHKFIRILLKRASVYQDILEILDKKYKALGGVKDTGITAALASITEQEQAAAQQVAPRQPEPALSQETSLDQSQPQASSPSAQPGTKVSTSGHIRLNDSMSDKEFEEWLRDKGMTQSGDRDKIIGEGINAKSFPYLEEVDVREVIGSLSLGGRGIFRRLWRENRISSDNEDSLSSHLDKELEFGKMHFKISQFLKDVPADDLRSLGGALGISHSKLLRMPESELAAGVVAAWLRKEDEVLTAGKPTLRILATHLKSIGQSGLAHDIFSTNGSCMFR